MKKNKLLNILKKSGTNKNDLYYLLSKIGIDNVSIDWLYNFSINYPYMILNLGNPLNQGGTHYVAVDNINKRYFDPFGLSPPNIITQSNYEWSPLQIQNIDFGHCGQYCCLWLYYSKHNELDRFYNLFYKYN